MRPALLVTVIALLALPAPAAAQAPQPGEAPDPAIADGTAQAALDRARDTWQVAGIHSYRFRVRHQCFCTPAFTKWSTIDVSRMIADEEAYYRAGRLRVLG